MRSLASLLIAPSTLVDSNSSPIDGSATESKGTAVKSVRGLGIVELQNNATKHTYVFANGGKQMSI